MTLDRLLRFLNAIAGGVVMTVAAGLFAYLLHDLPERAATVRLQAEACNGP